jgi:hypothetical protein
LHGHFPFERKIRTREISPFFVNLRRPTWPTCEKGTITVKLFALSRRKKIITLGLSAEVPGADIFDRANTMVGINDFLADLKGHAETPIHFYEVVIRPYGLSNNGKRIVNPTHGVVNRKQVAVNGENVRFINTPRAGGTTHLYY